MKYPEGLFSISNKTAIITGASRGIGADIANVFVKSGANVLGISRSNSPQNSRLNKHYQSCNIKDGERFDEETSGKYIIKELCHHFDPDRSFTSMKLVRDSFGDA